MPCRGRAGPPSTAVSPPESFSWVDADIPTDQGPELNLPIAEGALPAWGGDAFGGRRLRLAPDLACGAAKYRSSAPTSNSEPDLLALLEPDARLKQNRARGRRRVGAALVQQHDDELASCGNLAGRRNRCTRCGSARPGWMAHIRQAEGAGQHHPASVAAQVPELNPTENIWQYLRDNWLSNRVFASGHHIVDHCCDAWNRLVDQPWTIMSIGLRDWAHGL